MKKMKEIKNWVFASGKRKAAVLTALGVTAVAGASSLAVFALWEDQGVFPSRIPAVSANTVQAAAAGGSSQLISGEEAFAAVLAHAGLTEADVTVTENHLDWDDGVQEYDIDFYTDSKEYDYTVNAQTGEVRSYSIEARKQAGTASDAGSVIGEDAALAAALKHAGLGSGDVQVVKNKLDWDDGVQEYEIEFYSGSTEYDYSVNAQTGEIRHYDAETHGAPASSGSTGSVIGEDAALAAALKHAGLGSGDVSRTRTELDRDDGRTVYEVEFRSGGYEYEYTVNAADGSILEHQKEYDD